MISVEEVVSDPDMTAPQPYQILRSTGTYVLGGFQSTVTTLDRVGPVQQASDKEIQMLAEADRIGGARSFWSTQQIFTTRGAAPVPGVQGETPEGSGQAYTLSAPPPGGTANVYAGGQQLSPGVDYILSGTALTFLTPPASPLYVTWQVTVMAGQSASDILVYEGYQYRVMRVYFDPGGGFWKAVGTRMQSA
jgi:hypothetical protein